MFTVQQLYGTVLSVGQYCEESICSKVVQVFRTTLSHHYVTIPFWFRISKSLGYLIYVIHVNSCIYYSISAWEGLKSTDWTYNGQGNAYLRCFYFATKVATSIGNTEDPTNVVENLYMLISWMMGVFIVAMLLGQVINILMILFKDAQHEKSDTF